MVTVMVIRLIIAVVIAVIVMVLILMVVVVTMSMMEGPYFYLVVTLLGIHKKDCHHEYRNTLLSSRTSVPYVVWMANVLKTLYFYTCELNIT